MNYQTEQTLENQEQQSKPPASSKLSLLLSRRHLTKNELIEELQKNERWNLSSKKYSREHLEAVFEKFTRPEDLAFLWLHWNGLSNICKMVIQPQYTKLKIMNLGGNNIVSIELLQHARMPTLEELWLWSNLLTRVDALRKMYVPNLKYIDLSTNYIVEWNRLSELSSINLEVISVQNNLFGSINSFLKLLLSSRNRKLVNFIDNQLVRPFGQANNKGKKNLKTAKNYHYPTQRIEYV